METPASEPGDRQVFGVGDALDWDAPWKSVQLWTELPFWLMVRNCTIAIVESGHTFTVDVVSTFHEFHVNETLDSKRRCVYVGPVPPRMNRQLAAELEETQASVMSRKCKTIIRIHSRCNEDALHAAEESDPRRRRDARSYLLSLCAAHLPVVNHVIQSYRLATYDYFPYQVSPWDVPTWLVHTDNGFVRSSLQPYREWDYKPHIGPIGGDSTEYELIDDTTFAAAMNSDAATPGEFELLDALTLMERGDYSGAVRRIATSLEVVVEDRLRSELSKTYADAEVTEKLQKSRNDFPGRVRQYEKLSGRQLSDTLRAEIETTRTLRHDIVHRGVRIDFTDKGRAQRSVDTGRWAFNWFENVPERMKLRETRLATRSIGRHALSAIFDAQLTEQGVDVVKPDLLDDKREPDDAEQ